MYPSQVYYTWCQAISNTYSCESFQMQLVFPLKITSPDSPLLFNPFHALVASAKIPKFKYPSPAPFEIRYTISMLNVRPCLSLTSLHRSCNIEASTYWEIGFQSESHFWENSSSIFMTGLMPYHNAMVFRPSTQPDVADQLFIPLHTDAYS